LDDPLDFVLVLPQKPLRTSTGIHHPSNVPTFTHGALLLTSEKAGVAKSFQMLLSIHHFGIISNVLFTLASKNWSNGVGLEL